MSGWEVLTNSQEEMEARRLVKGFSDKVII